MKNHRRLNDITMRKRRKVTVYSLLPIIVTQALEGKASLKVFRQNSAGGGKFPDIARQELPSFFPSIVKASGMENAMQCCLNLSLSLFENSCQDIPGTMDYAALQGYLWPDILYSSKQPRVTIGNHQGGGI